MEFDPVKALKLLQYDIPDSVPFLTEDLSVAQARACAIHRGLLKKYLGGVKQKDLDPPTYAAFFAANDSCANFSFAEGSYYDVYVQRAQSILERVFMSGELQSPRVTLDLCFLSGGAGPGASVGTHGNNDFYSKMFNGVLSTCTPGLYSHYNSLLSPRWKSAELLRQHRYGVLEVEGSTLGTAAKSRDINRTTATEPSLNMFYQKGAGSLIEGLLVEFFNIDISKQPDVNRRLAQQGSLYGWYCTLDLKQASDLNARKLFKRLLPSSIFWTLDFIRSPKTLYNGEYRELHMFSSMGNGFTFPLMTIMYAALIRAVLEVEGLPFDVWNENPQYSVFGDDIIVGKNIYYKVVRLLEYCGATVNSEKSFATGSFRESCGGDFWKGENIRPIYLKKPINNEPQAYSAFNRLSRWSRFTGHEIPLLLKYVRSLARNRPVPMHAADTEGIKCLQDQLTSPKFDRNRSVYYRPLRPIQNHLRVVSRRGDDDPDNPHGALIAFLGGYIRDHVITRRSVGEVAYKVGRALTPCWDWCDAAELTTLGFEPYQP